MFTSVAFSGSRGLPSSFAPLVSRVCASLVAAGASAFSVGDARGADALVRSCLPGARVFSVASVPSGVPSRAALALRSRACVQSVAPSGAVVAFVSSLQSPGTFGALAFAVRLGLPCFVFLCGVPLSALPSLGGRWVAVGSGPLAGSFTWQPVAVQASLSG